MSQTPWRRPNGYWSTPWTERDVEMITALIVDDEPLARSHLCRLLKPHNVRVIGEADSAAAALQLAEDLQPDVILLDIQMPGLTGMQMASALIQLDTPPLLVFVTGFSEHAIAAFDHDAVDYLVKPVASERLAKTLVRVRERLNNRPAYQGVQERIEERTAESAPLRRLPVRGNYAVRLVRV